MIAGFYTISNIIAAFWHLDNQTLASVDSKQAEILSRVALVPAENEQASQAHVLLAMKWEQIDYQY